MSNLFPRASYLQVHTLVIRGLDIEFSVARSLKPEQNTAEVTIYNLSRENRKQLQEVPGDVVVKLHAGYLGPDPTTPTVGGNDAPILDQVLPMIFLGKLRQISNVREGADWITRISSGDGDGKDRPIAFSLGPGASLTDAIKRITGELQVGIGNAAQAILGTSESFAGGVVAFGPGDKELERLLRSIGKEYSVQNGELQVLDKGRPVNTPAIEIRPLGSPEIGTKGEVKARTFLTSQIYPGRQVRLVSESVSGYFRVETATYSGQTAGHDWFVDFEGKPVHV